MGHACGLRAPGQPGVQGILVASAEQLWTAHGLRAPGGLVFWGLHGPVLCWDEGLLISVSQASR